MLIFRSDTDNNEWNLRHPFVRLSDAVNTSVIPLISSSSIIIETIAVYCR